MGGSCRYIGDDAANKKSGNGEWKESLAISAVVGAYRNLTFDYLDCI